MKEKLLYNLYKKGLIDLLKKTYYTQCSSCKLKNREQPRYTKDEFIEKYSNDSIYIKLYENWILSNFSKEKIPSCDRMDNFKTYSFDNINIVTWKENEERQKNSQEQKEIARKVGLANRKSSIIQKDLQGNIIKIFINGSKDLIDMYNSIQISHILSTCRSEHKYAYGYKWEYNK